MPQQMIQLSTQDLKEAVMCLLHHRVGLTNLMPPAHTLTSEFWDRAERGIRFMVDWRPCTDVVALVPTDEWKP